VIIGNYAKLWLVIDPEAVRACAGRAAPAACKADAEQHHRHVGPQPHAHVEQIVYLAVGLECRPNFARELYACNCHSLSLLHFAEEYRQTTSETAMKIAKSLHTGSLHNELPDIKTLTRTLSELDVTLTQDPVRTLNIRNPLNPNQWKTLLHALPASLQISELIMSHQTFDEQGSASFASCMDRMPKLQSLRLTHCNMGAFKPIWPPLKHLKNLHLESITHPCELLMHILGTSGLITLHVRTFQQVDIGIQQHFDIAKALQSQTDLRELTLRHLPSGEELESVLGSYITNFLEPQTKLEFFSLPGALLNQRHCTMLQKVLQEKTALTSLSLAGDNRITPLDGPAIAKLVSLKNLVSLDLSSNLFSEESESLEQIFQALTDHPKLKHLDLNLNDNGPLAARLATFLMRNKTLISLNLESYGDEHLADLTKAMQQNHALRILSMPAFEPVRRILPAEDLRLTYPNHVELMRCVERNWQEWEKKMDDSVPFIEGGMRVVLSSMAEGRLPDDPAPLSNVHYDIAGYAARIAMRMIGEDAVTVTRLNKMVLREGTEALERNRNPKN
jgi:hypothetical protein